MWRPRSSMRWPSAPLRPLAPLPPRRHPIWWTVTSYSRRNSGELVNQKAVTRPPTPPPTTATFVRAASVAMIPALPPGSRPGVPRSVVRSGIRVPERGEYRIAPPGIQQVVRQHVVPPVDAGSPMGDRAGTWGGSDPVPLSGTNPDGPTDEDGIRTGGRGEVRERPNRKHC